MSLGGFHALIWFLDRKNSQTAFFEILVILFRNWAVSDHKILEIYQSTMIYPLFIQGTNAIYVIRSLYPLIRF